MKPPLLTYREGPPQSFNVLCANESIELEWAAMGWVELNWLRLNGGEPPPRRTPRSTWRGLHHKLPRLEMQTLHPRY